MHRQDISSRIYTPQALLPTFPNTVSYSKGDQNSSHNQNRHEETIKRMIPGGKPSADSDPLSLARFKMCLKLFSRPFGRGCGSCCRSKLSNHVFIAGDALTSENGCLLALGGLPLLFTSTLPIVRTCEANFQTPIPPPSLSIIPPLTT